MNATQALALIMDIPTEDIIIGKFTDTISKCCPIGHLQRLSSDDPTDYSLSNCADVKGFESMFGGPDTGSPIRVLSHKYAASLETPLTYINDRHQHVDLAAINNGRVAEYQQPTPKERTVQFLTDMIAGGY